MSQILTDFGPVAARDDTHVDGSAPLDYVQGYLAYVNRKAEGYFVWHQEGLAPKFLGYRAWLIRTRKIRNEH